ncbi:hypothetical protein EGT74_23510 [Chitinophaga lutea]|uniref:Uncharacterized protein n=1 Tax=Chitinophaga lutea TaxID=2488634 RepID=A0A3N4PFR9_9BACT|nr:hypothetical protein EGT74_23510 [Chitinophaga lutea]
MTSLGSLVPVFPAIPIPQELLPDPDGKIVAKNINVTAFDQTIGDVVTGSKFHNHILIRMMKHSGL